MSLAQAFLSRLAEPTTPTPQRVETLERELARVCSVAFRAWPALDSNPNEFVAYIAERIPPGAGHEDAIADLHVEELYLAYACQAGDRRAIAALETTYASHLDAVLSTFRGKGLTREDFDQIVRRRLFVADAGGPPRIARYSGAGSLAAWLRVTVRRAALNAIRGAAPPEAAADDLFEFPQTLGDPELDYLKETYRAEFKAAFMDAVERLSARDRMLLRQSIVHGLTVRQLGRMYKVHHGTVARWIAAAREALVAETRAALGTRLQVSQRELESIMGLIQSRFEVSIVRVLGSE